MKSKTARRWLARSRHHLAKARALDIGNSKALWKRYWLCLSLTSILFRRFDLSNV